MPGRKSRKATKHDPRRKVSRRMKRREAAVLKQTIRLLENPITKPDVEEKKELFMSEDDREYISKLLKLYPNDDECEKMARDTKANVNQLTAAMLRRQKKLYLESLQQNPTLASV